eukprot:3788901-Rhodomonas_salina.1
MSTWQRHASPSAPDTAQRLRRAPARIRMLPAPTHTPAPASRGSAGSWRCVPASHTTASAPNPAPSAGPGFPAPPDPHPAPHQHVPFGPSLSRGWADLFGCRAADHRSGHPDAVQVLDLVEHEREQRRNDHRDSAGHDGRELVA